MALYDYKLSGVSSLEGRVAENGLREAFEAQGLEIDRIVWDETFTKVAVFFKDKPDTEAACYSLPSDWQEKMRERIDGTRPEYDLEMTPDAWMKLD